MTFSFPLAQGVTLAENFSFKRGLPINTEKGNRFVRGAFDGHFALKGLGTFLQGVEVPIDPQDILDGNIPFNALVLKPQSAAFDVELETLSFVSFSMRKGVTVIFTDTGTGLDFLEDGPGMWVLVGGESGEVEQVIRVTDGTDILIPEVHLAELTGVFGDVIIAGSPILPDSETWSKCLPFARFCYSTVLTLSQSTCDALQPQLTEELPVGALVAIID
jgi:hypothetical protein